ncbi:MAG: DNA primase [Candidatus Bathyarchaeia archaeon]|nr:DNA primase [Candidatus Bathyarchaeota archaeon]
MKYILPEGLRYSTLSERRNFYRDEFNLSKVSKWISRRVGHNIFAVIIGRHTKIYMKRFSRHFSKTIIIDDYRGLNDVRSLILKFLPESVYYDRNIYSRVGGQLRVLGQELAFDLDPENIVCPIHGSLKDKMLRGQGLSFCALEFKMVRMKTVELYERLSSLFTDISAVYSGRGFHLHIFDPETLTWSFRERRRLASKIRREGYPIDEWVTAGGMRLIRLPYSLHGMVSRIVTPLTLRQLECFDPVKSRICIPKFIGKG